MRKSQLPADLRGDWIWASHLLKKVESRLFARKEFILDSTVPYADLWVSSRQSYHLFVNGVHAGYGPSPAPKGLCYADCHDISCHLQTGANVIAMLSGGTSLPCYGRPANPPGIWCQLTLDGKPSVWTDNSWHILDGSCYESGQPRRHSGLEFVERLNLESFPSGWSEPGFNDRGWERPDLTSSIKEGRPKLEASPFFKPCAICESDPLSPVSAGDFFESDECTHVSFSNIFGGEAGVYAAQTFFRSDKEWVTPVRVASDDPFILFCNDRMELSRCVSQAHSGQSNMKSEDGLYLQEVPFSSSPFVKGGIRIKQGWNRLLVVQETGSGSMGFMLGFPGVKERSLKFMREDHIESLCGWRLSGPLRMPLAAATGSLRLERTDSYPYTAVNENINDVSFWLSCCAFKGREGAERDLHSKGLKSGEFAVYDLGSPHYGFPVVELVGGGGDIVDVSCGLPTADGLVPSACDAGRNTDTLSIRAGTNTWTRFVPRGAEKIMITVRKSSSLVFPTVKFESIVKEQDEESDFSCSDPVFNRIWETGKATLAQTAGLSLLDSPCGCRAQSLPDAFIQSMSCIYSFGDWEISAKALREFALAQAENGNMPEFSCNDIYSYIPDYALLWPMWLEFHWQATGDMSFLDEMLPHLDLLLDFFMTMAAENSGSLADLDRKYSLNCVIDPYAPAIDRRGMSTALNALFCRALLSSANLYDAVGNEGSAKACRKGALHNAGMLRDATFDKSGGLFADAVSDGKLSGRRSVQTETMALLSGAFPDSAVQAAITRLIKRLADAKEPVPGSYFNYFLLEALFAFGQQDEAFKFMKRYWGGMLSAGDSVWRSAFNPANPSEPVIGDVQCHGGACSPNIFIIRELAGIRPAVPGFSKIYFNPAVGTVSRAKASIPTPYGRISIEWRMGKEGELEVDADANYPLDIAPMLPPDMLGKCTFNLGDSVSVLDPESAS